MPDINSQPAARVQQPSGQALRETKRTAYAAIAGLDLSRRGYLFPEHVDIHKGALLDASEVR
jgi:hypothetical protein